MIITATPRETPRDIIFKVTQTHTNREAVRDIKGGLLVTAERPGLCFSLSPGLGGEGDRHRKCGKSHFTPASTVSPVC